MTQIDVWKSTTSVALRKLERYRFVRRLPRGADRKDYYEPVTDPLELIEEWARYFVVPELEVSAGLVKTFERDVGEAAQSGEYDEQARAVMSRRAAELRRAMSAGRSLAAILSEPEQFETLLAMVGRHAQGGERDG